MKHESEPMGLDEIIQAVTAAIKKLGRCLSFSICKDIDYLTVD